MTRVRGMKKYYGPIFFGTCSEGNVFDKTVLLCLHYEIEVTLQTRSALKFCSSVIRFQLTSHVRGEEHRESF